MKRAATRGAARGVVRQPGRRVSIRASSPMGWPASESCRRHFKGDCRAAGIAAEQEGPAAGVAEHRFRYVARQILDAAQRAGSQSGAQGRPDGGWVPGAAPGLAGSERCRPMPGTQKNVAAVSCAPGAGAPGPSPIGSAVWHGRVVRPRTRGRNRRRAGRSLVAADGTSIPQASRPRFGGAAFDCLPPPRPRPVPSLELSE